MALQLGARVESGDWGGGALQIVDVDGSESETQTDSESQTASACRHGSVVKTHGLMRTQYFGICITLARIWHPGIALPSTDM